MVTLEVLTRTRNEFIEITELVQEALVDSGVRDGLLTVHVPHTTAGVTINENADPDVVSDMLADLARLVPERQPYYRHYEGNSSSHLKASIMGNAATIPVSDGRLTLGRWQGIYLCEFDGPRRRTVMVAVLPGSPADRG